MTSIISAVLAVYFIIGILFGFMMIKSAEIIVNKHEKGEEVTDDQLKSVTTIGNIYKIHGVPKGIASIMINMAVLWPLIIIKAIKGGNG